MSERSDWFDIGDVVIPTAVYQDEVTGVLVDPTNMVVTVRDPSGVETTPVIVRDSIGHYRTSVEPTLAGVWRVQWDSTGTGKASEPWHFLVRERLV